MIPRADLYLPQKGMDISMKKWKIAGLFAMTLMMSVTPIQAFATSPEFAYTAEKWASLQDNKLEYGEIADLIHEYNTTVRQNELDYQKYKGKTSTDIAKEYYDSAAEITERINYPEDDSANYANQLSSALISEISADNLTEQGDSNVDDGEIKRLGYEQAEKSLVQQAQKLMISYYSGKASLDTLEDAVTQAETAYTQAQTKKSAGMALQSDVDTAAESVTTAKASLQSAKSSLEQTRQQLVIMLGWNYNDSVEFGKPAGCGYFLGFHHQCDIRYPDGDHEQLQHQDHGAQTCEFPVGEQPCYLYEYIDKPEGYRLHECEERLQQPGTRKRQLRTGEDELRTCKEGTGSSRAKALRRNHHKEDIREAGIRLPFCENFHGIREVKLSHCKDQL